MGLFGFLSKQFVDVIDWVDEPGTLADRHPMQGRAIQNGAQLTVRDGQIALFHREGQLADAFHPGLHRLETGNLPVLTALLNWDKGFASPFKADVTFFSQKEQTGRKWGTTQPITVRDPEFGPLRVRAFGSYSFRIEQVAAFAVKLMGSLERVTVTDIEPQLRAAIGTALASALGSGEIAFLDLAANQAALSERLKAAIDPAFAQWGLACTSFYIESLSLPEEVQAMLDKVGAMRVAGDLDTFARFQAAAGEPGDDAAAQIEKLHRLLTIGAITQQEFDAKKTELLGTIR
jgi:membrane protease subunit (stomatin/prohibitin family)